MTDCRLFHMIIYFVLSISFLNSSLIIVCTEKDITEKNEYTRMEYQLQHLTDTLEIFEEEQKCIDYISTIPVSQPSLVYFIVSGKFYDSIFFVVQEQQHIRPLIYIFCPPGTSTGFIHKKRENELHPFFFDHNCLISTLSKDLDTEEKISMSVNIQELKNVSIKCLDKESQTFLLFQMLAFIFQNHQHDTTEIDDFQNVFSQYDEKYIPNFEQTYLLQDIIQWYTSDKFFSRLVDEAFQSKNISLLFKLRFLIISLLNKSYNQSPITLSDNNEKILTSYRRECIKNDKLIKLKLNVNRLLSINQFYVTTTEKSNQILQQSESADVECALFQIDIDTSMEMIQPYFIINNYRSEILFTFGTVFQIHSVELDTKTRLWNVKLIKNAEVQNQVIDLIDQLKDKFGFPLDFMTMGRLMDDISEYNKAIECYRIFLDKTPEDDEDISMAYMELGLSYYHNESYIEALNNYDRALRLYRLKSIPPHDPEFADIYTHIGDAYCARHQYAVAIDYYKEAIRIQEINLSFKSVMRLNIEIGAAYSKIGDKQNYNEYTSRSIWIQHGNSSFIRGSDDPSFKSTINHTTSLENFQKVLIDLLNNKTSSTQHFDYDIATVHYKIGEIYFKMENYEQALQQFNKVVDIYLKALPTSLSNLVNYDTITDTSIIMLRDYLSENEHHFRFIPLRYSLLVETYHYIAKIYFLEPKHMEIALSFYKLANTLQSIQQDY